MAHQARAILQGTGEIHVERVPDQINLASGPSSIDVHLDAPESGALHLWSVERDLTAMSVQVILDGGTDCRRDHVELRDHLMGSIGIDDLTIEVRQRTEKHRHRKSRAGALERTPEVCEGRLSSQVCMALLRAALRVDWVA